MASGTVFKWSAVAIVFASVSTLVTIGLVPKCGELQTVEASRRELKIVEDSATRERDFILDKIVTTQEAIKQINETNRVEHKDLRDMQRKILWEIKKQ